MEDLCQHRYFSRQSSIRDTLVGFYLDLLKHSTGVKDEDNLYSLSLYRSTSKNTFHSGSSTFHSRTSSVVYFVMAYSCIFKS